MLRAFGAQYAENHPLSPQQRKIIHALSVCRTAALGGHLHRCTECGHEQPAYNSCRNRHCPKCQGISMRKWLNARTQELLPVPYFHVIFTLPHAFNKLVPYNEKFIYDTVFKSAAASLLRLSQQQLGGRVGILAVLHTWGQQLQRHIHLHCLVTGGALSTDRTRWIPTSDKYLFDVTKLSAVYRDMVSQRLRSGLDADALIQEQAERDWNVYCKKPFSGPQTVLEYLGRYTHRVAISNRRILDITDTHVTFDYKDYNDTDENDVPKHKPRKLTDEEFIRRFLLHVLPHRYTRIRSYGFMAGSDRKRNLALCKQLLNASPIDTPSLSTDPEPCPICELGILLPVMEILPQKRFLYPPPDRRKRHAA
ncbi:IS91 family transposase [Planctomycetota bacterium]